MGQHNIDKEFGRKLREREIDPQPQSWDKLNSRLEKEQKGTGSYRWILAIAASLVAGFLIMGLVYRADVVDEAPQVVETPKEIKNENIVNKQHTESQLAVDEVEKPVEERKIQHTSLTTISPAPKKAISSQIVGEIDNFSDLAESNVALIAEEEKPEVPNEHIPEELEGVIAAVSSNLAKKENLAEAEVDSLLMIAAAKISRERENYLAGASIDAGALLWDVEMEMEQSFREKVFDIMKEGYLKARTAVANRNY